MVNGVLVKSDGGSGDGGDGSNSKRLRHGDKIILGHSHFYRFKDPAEARELRKNGKLGADMGKDMRTMIEELAKSQAEAQMDANRYHIVLYFLLF